MVIERRDVASPAKEENVPPPLPPRLQPSAPPPEILDNVHWPKPYFPYLDYRNVCGFYHEGMAGSVQVVRSFGLKIFF